jgi:hypothetical protein
MVGSGSFVLKPGLWMDEPSMARGMGCGTTENAETSLKTLKELFGLIISC